MSAPPREELARSGWSAVIEDQASVSLPELLRLAPLMSRVDRKYVVATGDVAYLLEALAQDVLVLEIQGRREFGYRSLYFDTPDLDSFHSTVRRRRHRFKIRTRSYLDTGLHVLELKTRGSRGLTDKLRLPYDGDGESLSTGERAGLVPPLSAAQVSVDPYALEPALSTTYRRTTLFLPRTQDRVTIDQELTWMRGEQPAAAVAGVAIVEVKSLRATSAADRLLWSMGIRPAVLSKYGTGLALLRPDLPATPWTPVLRRQISPALRQDPTS